MMYNITITFYVYDDNSHKLYAEFQHVTYMKNINYFAHAEDNLCTVGISNIRDPSIVENLKEYIFKKYKGIEITFDITIDSGVAS